MLAKIVLRSLKDDKLYTFIYPDKLNYEVVVGHVTEIRFGHHNWERKLHDHAIESMSVQENFHDLATEEMKYIVHGNKTTGIECMVAFSKSIDHDRANEMLMHMHFGGNASEEIDVDRPFSAGFIYNSGTTHGRSESMNVESRKQDTALAKSGMLKLKEKVNG